MQLSEVQIQFIYEDLMERGLTLARLHDSIHDHICSALEMHSGNDFQLAYAEVISRFGEKGLIQMQEETIKLLNHKKDKKMKKLIYVIGFLAVFLSSSGILFKVMHWKGASMILVLGVFLFNFGFLPLFFRYRYKKSVSE